MDDGFVNYISIGSFCVLAFPFLICSWLPLYNWWYLRVVLHVCLFVFLSFDPIYFYKCVSFGVLDKVMWSWKFLDCMISSQFVSSIVPWIDFVVFYSVTERLVLDRVQWHWLVYVINPTKLNDAWWWLLNCCKEVTLTFVYLFSGISLSMDQVHLETILTLCIYKFLFLFLSQIRWLIRQV